MHLHYYIPFESKYFFYFQNNCVRKKKIIFRKVFKYVDIAHFLQDEKKTYKYI